VKFTFKKMTEESAHCIASWHYPPPYNFYDMDQDPEDLAELLDPQTWQESKHAAFNEENELVGFFSFREQGQTVEVGLGLRPDLTGKSLGRAFLDAGMTFGKEHFAVGMWSLNVATFNTRAIRLYEHAGFTPLHAFLQHTNGGEYEFLRMVRTR
jgi:[ribosomal protein S18]-alanine N-acetyltransferase